MDPATLSLVALAIAIVFSCTIRLHVGFLSIALAWIVGVYIAGMSVRDVMAGFPTSLFITLAGVTLLFAQAQANGTLDLIARKAVRLCRGNVGVMPMMFFALSFVLSSIGPGSIASTALMAPMGMAVAGQVGIPAFWMAIMIGHGGNAAALSPFAPAGIIVNGIMEDIGLGGHEMANYLNNAMAHIVVVFAGYLLFGGWKLLSRRHDRALEMPTADGEGSTVAGPFEKNHWITIGVIGALLAAVVVLDVDVGLGAFACAIVLALFKAADESDAVNRMPWSVIMMVCGVTVLISVLDATGDLALFTRILAGISTADTVTAIMAFTTGFISIYSSTSGVVLPAFLPTVPDLAAQLGNVNPLAIASSMNIGAHLVDVSALSTLGALCMAAAPKHEDSQKLFNHLMVWGLSMTLVGAAICWLFFTAFGVGLG